MQLTPFEDEILDSILWQLEGFRKQKVTERATKRILRATMRRIKPKLIARSVNANLGVEVEVDHAVPVNVIVQKIMECNLSTKASLKDVICTYLVAVELTKVEHKKLLKMHKLESEMPGDWDGQGPYARYIAAGIKIIEC